MVIRHRHRKSILSGLVVTDQLRMQCRIGHSKNDSAACLMTAAMLRDTDRMLRKMIPCSRPSKMSTGIASGRMF